MAVQLAKRSDEGVFTDNQDEMDHGVQPTDPNVLSSKNRIGIIQWFGVLSMLMHNALEIL